jgi:CheY-like chemotaxis protein
MIGPEVLLAPQAFSIAALVFHELVTNSAKYGSLCDSGTVAVDWQEDETGNLVIDWRESDGPPVKQPTRQGFGTTIIRRSIPYELGGKAEIRYEPTGLQAHFAIPAKFTTFADGAVSLLPDQALQSAKAVLETIKDRPLDGFNILLVEDNLIIAMDGEDIFLQLGAQSVALAPNVSHALAAIEKRHFDLAVLDVHLGEETSIAVAERLAAKGVPLILATGYGEGVSQSYGALGANLLQKPYTIESVASALSRIAPIIKS